MTIAGTIGSVRERRAAESATTLFNGLLIYRFGLAIAVIDFLDVYDFIQRDNFVKYTYAAIVLWLMAVYYVRWQKVEFAMAQALLLLFFVVTGVVFAIRFFIFEEKNSYVSAFISPLIFVASIFIPTNAVILNARKILRDLTIIFALGTVFYLFEAFIRPFGFIVRGLNEVTIIKSLVCVLAISLAILVSRKTLALVLAAITVLALDLRPASTLVLGLIFCLPIAITLRPRISSFRVVSVLLARAIAMSVLALAVSVPLLLYFFFDDVGAAVTDLEGWLKGDVIGGISNVAFRLAILKFAFVTLDNSSFWYGSALSGSLTVPLGQSVTWQWWFYLDPNGEAPIHSDFVVVLCLMGIIGYVLFSGIFYFVLRNPFRELLYRKILGGSAVLQAISIVAAVAIVIYSSDEPYLAYFSHTHVVWLLLLISAVARKSKIVF